MDDRVRETLVIAQEEAAEVIQEISKCFRFGLDTNHRDGMTHRVKLEQELGDFLAMVGLLVQQGVVNETNMEQAAQHKMEKLRKYSNILK